MNYDIVSAKHYCHTNVCTYNEYLKSSNDIRLVLRNMVLFETLNGMKQNNIELDEMVIYFKDEYKQIINPLGYSPHFKESCPSIPLSMNINYYIYMSSFEYDCLMMSSEINKYDITKIRIYTDALFYQRGRILEIEYEKIKCKICDNENIKDERHKILDKYICRDCYYKNISEMKNKKAEVI